MARSLLVLALVAGCSTGTDPGAFAPIDGDRARLGALDLSYTISGDQVVFEVSGASRNDEVELGSGTAVGNGPCFVALDWECFDIEAPVLEGSERANSGGVAQFTIARSAAKGGSGKRWWPRAARRP